MNRREEAFFVLSGLLCFSGICVLLYLKLCIWTLPAFILLFASGEWSIRRLYRKAECMEELLAEIPEAFVEGRRAPGLLCEDAVYLRQVDHLKELALSLDEKEERRRKDMEWLRSLMADAAHQLKTPLASMEIYMDIFEGELRGGAAAAFLSRAREAMERMRLLLSGILRLAQLESGAACPNKRLLPLGDTVQKSMGDVQAMALKKKLSIVLTQSGVGEAELLHDPDWLREAFTNILKNAVEYAPECSDIDIELTDTPLAVMLTLKDRGEGILPEELPKIFTRFYRAKRADGSRSGGAGLGLALARRLIEAHGGVLTAESRCGTGSYSCFIATLLKDA